MTDSLQYIFNKLSNLQNVKFKIADLEKIRDNKQLEYYHQLMDEYHEICSSLIARKGRTDLEILEACKKGKLAEIIGYEFLKENDQPILKKCAKKYHDACYIETPSIIIEWKNYSAKTIENSIEKFLMEDAKTYNISDILVACVSDDENIWIDSVLIIDRSTDSPIIPKIFKSGKSYTISSKVYNTLDNYEFLEFIDGVNSVIKSTWSIKPYFRASNRGAESGGYYVMHDWLSKC